MSAVRTAAGALLRSRDRATSALTVAAFALPHAFLLAVTGGVMAFGARAAEAAASGTGDDPSTLDGMGPLYVMLAYFAATLLVVPIISMGAAAARLGMSRRERDLAVLRLMGLAPGATKLACILETCVFAVVGVVVGSLGAGGGIVSVPILVYVLGQDPHQATGLSLIIVGLTAAVSLATRARSGNVAWREATIFALAGLAGTWAGAALAPLVSARGLMLSFCALLVAVAIFMVRSQLRPVDSSSHETGAQLRDQRS